MISRRPISDVVRKCALCNKVARADARAKIRTGVEWAASAFHRELALSRLYADHFRDGSPNSLWSGASAWMALWHAGRGFASPIYRLLHPFELLS